MNKINKKDIDFSKMERVESLSIGLCPNDLYKDDSFKPIYDGDCPESPEVDPDAPVDGKCPINKPIKSSKISFIAHFFKIRYC